MSERSITANSRYAVSLTAAVGLAATLVITSADFAPAYQNRALHVAKETVGALVLLLVAAVLAGRFSRRGSLTDVIALAGILVLAVKNLVFSVLTAIVAESAGGLVTWRTTGAGTVVAALLLVAALAPRRVVRERRRAVAIAVVGSLLAFVLLSAAAALLDFPGALTERPHTDAEVQAFRDQPALIVADAVAAALFLLAGALFARRAERDVDEFQLWLGVGATIAGIGYLNHALLPSSYTDFLYAGDLFRVAAVAAFAIGTIREIAKYQAVYAPAAVLEDRRRVARELHDGVAQELALIAARVPGLEREGHDPETMVEIREAVRRALDESRAAISTLNRPLEEPLHTALATTAREVAERGGARVVLDLDEDVVVSPLWEQALSRIVREAVANAVRHGHATTITVHLRDTDDVWLRVTDDGKGFDPSQPHPPSSFGLISMRERAEALGGHLRVESEPGRGTSVEVVLP
jgi:signal transduction histidine kinase